MNWKKFYIYFFGIILIISVLFVVTGISPSLLGLIILLLEIIKTPKSLITGGLFIFASFYAMNKISKNLLKNK